MVHGNGDVFVQSLQVGEEVGIGRVDAVFARPRVAATGCGGGVLHVPGDSRRALPRRRIPHGLMALSLRMAATPYGPLRKGHRCRVIGGEQCDCDRDGTGTDNGSTRRVKMTK